MANIRGLGEVNSTKTATEQYLTEQALIGEAHLQNKERKADTYSPVTGLMYDKALIIGYTPPNRNVGGGLGGRVSVSKVASYDTQHSTEAVVDISSDIGNGVYVTFEVAKTKREWSFVHTFIKRFTSVLESVIAKYGIVTHNDVNFTVQVNGSTRNGNVRTTATDYGLETIGFANVRFGQFFESKNNSESYKALRNLFVNKLGVSESMWVEIKYTLAQGLQDYDKQI